MVRKATTGRGGENVLSALRFMEGLNRRGLTQEERQKLMSIERTIRDRWLVSDAQWGALERLENIVADREGGKALQAAEAKRFIEKWQHSQSESES